MKTQIRVGTFESNSSSTHTLTLCMQEEFEAWKRGEVLFNQYSRWDDRGTFVKAYKLTEQDKIDAQEEYNLKKKKFWSDWDKLSNEEKEDWYNEYAKNNELFDEGYYTYEDYMTHSDLETFEQSYTSPSGDKIVAFGKYGYDG